MMLSRLLPSATLPSSAMKIPESSGPRWAMAAVMRSMAPSERGCSDWGAATPQMPHTSAFQAHLGFNVRIRSERAFIDVTEFSGDHRPSKLLLVLSPIRVGHLLATCAVGCEVSDGLRQSRRITRGHDDAVLSVHDQAGQVVD